LSHLQEYCFQNPMWQMATGGQQLQCQNASDSHKHCLSHQELLWLKHSEQKLQLKIGHCVIMAILEFKKCILFGLDGFSDMLRAMICWALWTVLKGGSTFCYVTAALINNMWCHKIVSGLNLFLHNKATYHCYFFQCSVLGPVHWVQWSHICSEHTIKCMVWNLAGLSCIFLESCWHN
jgi:hypothetical protein